MYQDEHKALKTLHDFTDSVIMSRRDELANSDKNINSSNNDDELGIKKKKAFLDMLLEATVDGKLLGNEEIREEVDTFMFAVSFCLKSDCNIIIQHLSLQGHDTTTSAISFILYNLAKHPDIQQQVFEESKMNLGDDVAKTATMQDLNKLHYLELVIKETLRMYPSAPLIGRKIFEETRLGDVTIPANTSVVIAPFFLGRDPKIFPNPLHFDPSRFDVETNNEKNNPYAYIPFSAGPRNCIGQKFAMLEMKSLTVKVVRNFQLSILKENEELELIAELVLRPQDGIVLCAKTRF